MMSVLLGAASVFTAPRDPAASEVIRGKLYCDLVAGVNSDKMHAHFSGDMRHDTVPVCELHLKHGVWQGFYDLSFDFDDIIFGQKLRPPLAPLGHAFGNCYQGFSHIAVFENLLLIQ